MKRNIARLSSIALLLALCLSVTTFVGTTPSAHAVAQAPQFQRLGNVKLDPYCQSLGYAKAGLADSTYYGWRCLNAQGSSVATINMQSACQWQYHNNSVVDYTTNFYDASSAQCFRITAYLGGIDLNGVCRQYMGSDWRAVTIGFTAYDWRCANSTNTALVPIDMGVACAIQTHVNPSLPRFFNFYSTTSWQCWS
jgi:hypothetical protein